MPQRSLGRGLGRALAVASVLGMVALAVIVLLGIWFHKVYDPTPDNTPFEAVREVAVAFALALPFGVGCSLLIHRRLTRATTTRLDQVISTSARLTVEHLEERLPIGDAGDSLDQLSAAINRVLDRIASGVGAQRRFAADASHELRTPITVMCTNLDVALQKARAPEHWERVAREVLAELRRMNLLVDKLLALARVGEASLQRTATDLRTVADAAVERAISQGAARKVSIALAPGPAVIAKLDADAIAIVIDNLIRNAIDHSPSGEQVIVSVGRGPLLSVEDRGPGVPVERREHIFAAFARGVHRRTDRSVGVGMGLGLAISQRIVVGHGGAIRVEDRDGGGARFVVELPDFPD